MKRVTLIRYVARDGKSFLLEDDCIKYEKDGCVEFTSIPNFGDHVLLTEQNLRQMVSGDGSCYYATKDKMSRISARYFNHPTWATHLMYFSK